MTRLGLSVPAGFVITIDAFREYKRTGRIPKDEIESFIAVLEEKTGKVSVLTCPQ
jgi:phosphoenolpyruvate synthase/pyruvate phosphate dikinase